MFEKDQHKIKLINRQGIELKGYFNKTNDKKCVVAFCGFGGNCDNAFCAVANICEENDISFLFANTQGSYAKKSLKQHLSNGDVVMVERGAFCEDFDECVDDLKEWIDFANNQGFEEIYLLGASIACNRIVSYLNKYEYPKTIKKIIFHCPQHLGPQIDPEMLEEAQSFLSQNRSQEILTKKFFGFFDVTARTYFNLAKNPQLDNLPYLTGGDFSMLKAISLPIRVVIGSLDDGIVCYSDKSVEFYMEILKKNSVDLQYTIIDGAKHTFKHKEQELAQITLEYILK